MKSNNRLEDYYEDITALIVEEFDGDEAAAAGTIATNTTGLRTRAERILARVAIRRDDEVAEVGCGYGFLALALAKLTGARITGYDVSPKFLNVAHRLLERRPELKALLTFHQADYAQDSLPENSADVAVIYGSFFYIVDRQLQQSAADNLWRVLRPGGQVYFYHPNLLFPIEAFTRQWFVHWLPRRLGTWLSELRGKRTMMDVSYQSPRGLRRLLHQAKFERIEHRACGKASPLFGGPLSNVSPYYAMTARKPGNLIRAAA